MHATSTAHAPITARMGYNGQLHESTRAWQALGNGHRIYNPVLMRFHSADDWSPFARGGVNAYAYCENEPMNRIDPSGRFFLLKYKFKLMPVATMFTGVTAALGAAAVAVSNPNETARILTIAGTISALTVTGLAGRYAWIKRRYRDPSMSRTAKAAQASAGPPTTANKEPSTSFAVGENAGIGHPSGAPPSAGYSWDVTPPPTPQTASTTLGSPFSMRKDPSPPSGSALSRRKSVTFSLDQGQQPVREEISKTADKLRRASLMERYKALGRRDSGY